MDQSSEIRKRLAAGALDVPGNRYCRIRITGQSVGIQGWPDSRGGDSRAELLATTFEAASGFTGQTCQGPTCTRAFGSDEGAGPNSDRSLCRTGFERTGETDGSISRLCGLAEHQ